MEEGQGERTKRPDRHEISRKAGFAEQTKRDWLSDKRRTAGCDLQR
jgi:hypothetical protein